MQAWKSMSVGLLVISLGSLGFTTYSFKAASSTEPITTVTVQGLANVMATPNQATISLGSQITEKSASNAMKKSATVTQAIITALEKAGVAANDIQTSGLSLNPTYNEAGTKVTGYQVEDTLTLTTAQVAAVGTLIDDASHAGANLIEGVTFGVSDPSTWYKKAYKLAMADALEQAKAVIAPEKEKVIGIESITTANSGSGTTVTSAAATATPTPVLPGETTFSVAVQVVYAVQ
jgi:uncharacterized protein YggE